VVSKLISYALCPPWGKISKTSFWGGLYSVSAASFAELDKAKNLSFVFVAGLLVDAAWNKAATSVGGMTPSWRPLSIKIGRVVGIFDILDIEGHFCVIRRDRKPPIGHAFTKFGMEVNVFSTIRAATWRFLTRYFFPEQWPGEKFTLPESRLAAYIATAPPRDCPKMTCIRKMLARLTLRARTQLLLEVPIVQDHSRRSQSPLGHQVADLSLS